MHTKLLLLGMTFGVFSSGYGQIPDGTLTVEERLISLEFQIATLDTRLNNRTTAGASSLGTADAALAAQIRIDALERQVGDMNRELRELARQVTAAAREASAARREARDAQSRIR